VFSLEENACLQASSIEQRDLGFYCYWTLKEARGKQQGTGLRIQEARDLTFRGCKPDQAEGMTWQNDGMTLALVGGRGIRAQLAGWSAPLTPRFWCAEAVQDSSSS
jgi:hypothetical protein